MKIINIDVKDNIIINNIEDIDTGDLTGVTSKIIIPTGNYNNIILNFDFHNNKLCEDLKMFANFNILSGASIDVALEKISAKNREFEYACYIPSEVLVAECKFTLGLYGFALNEDGSLKQRVSFVPIENSVVQGTYDPDSTEGLLPSPSVFEVYFQQVNDINEQIENEYQGIIDRLEEIKEEHINDFNEKIEPEKQKAIEDFNVQAEEKTEEVMTDIDKHFEENASSYRKDIDGNTVRIKRLESNIFDSGEASGTSINIKDSTLAEFQEIVVNGVSKQVTTKIENGDEYDSPTPEHPQEIEVVEAYNLFDKDNVVFKKGYILDDNGVETASAMSGYTTTFIEVKPNTTYTIQGKLCGSASNIRLYCYDKDKKWLKRTFGINYGAIPYTFTTDNSTHYIQIQAVIDDYDASTVQINKGNLKPYASYGYVKTIIKGKNLFDYSAIKTTTNGLTNVVNEDGSITTTGCLTADNLTLVGYEITDILDDGETYILGMKNPNKYIYMQIIRTTISDGKKEYFSNASDTISYYALRNVDKTKYKYTLKLVSTTMANWGTENLTITNTYQLEKSSIPTEFEPYQENNLDINLQGNFIGKIGDVKDTLRVENGRAILTKRIGKVVLNENSNIVLENTPTSGKNQFYLHVSDIKKIDNNTTLGVISDYFKGVIWESSWTKDNAIVSYINLPRIRIYTSKFSTSDEFKTWLAENPVTVYYVLATPYEVDLGEVDMPLSYYPETNVVTLHELSPNIKVKYYRDIKNTITNIQLDIETLKQAVATMTVNQTNPTNELDLLQEPIESESEE